MMGVEEDVIRAEKLNKVFSIKGKKPLTALNGLSLSVKKRRAHGSDRALTVRGKRR